jgi:hypothetical protein
MEMLPRKAAFFYAHTGFATGIRTTAGTGSMKKWIVYTPGFLWTYDNQQLIL